MNQFGIARRLAMMFALAVILITTASAFMLRSSLERTLITQAYNELLLRQGMLSGPLRAWDTEEEWKRIPGKLKSLTPVDQHVRYWVISDDPVYAYGDDSAARFGWRVRPDGWSWQQFDSESAPMILLFKTFAASEQRPTIQLVIGMSSASYLTTLREFTHALILTSAIGSLLVALFGYWIARFGLRPVRLLSRQANGLPPGDSKKRLDTQALPQELLELANSFNGALSRQEAAWSQLEGFNANVAHELRTPLTNLIGQTQIALAHERDIDALHDLLHSNLEELERMSTIVNDMLFLARAERGYRATDLSDVSLLEETLKTLEYLEPSLHEKSLQVNIHGDGRARIDKRLYHRSLANLVLNAARYAQPKSQVLIRLEHRGDRVEVSVSNEGESIAQADLERLFERFYRADPNRARSDTHHGLGLSIVRAVAVMHGGNVFARSEQGINTFGFSLSPG